MTFYVGQKVLEAFDKRYIPEPNSGCWLWTGACNDKGYGIIYDGSRSHYAHRFSYANFRGKIPDGMFVCHSCDTPGCCNPQHLFVGRQIDNMADCLAKGRHASRNGFVYPRGAQARCSKLTEDNVKEIKASKGLVSQRKLAEKFSVVKSTIAFIQQGKTWTHV